MMFVWPIADAQWGYLEEHVFPLAEKVWGDAGRFERLQDIAKRRKGELESECRAIVAEITVVLRPFRRCAGAVKTWPTSPTLGLAAGS